MKKSIVILFSFLVACNTATTNQTPEGMYVCQFENEFSKISDTLLLKRMSTIYYTITRHSGVTGISDNKKQMIMEVWKLEFEESKNVFTAMKTGRMIIWDADKGELVFGNRSYIKKL